MAGLFPQALNQLADGLRRALQEYDVYDQSRDPAASVKMAAAEFAAAANLVEELYGHLSAAQTAINYQGITEDDAGNLRRRPPLRIAPKEEPGPL